MCLLTLFLAISTHEQLSCTKSVYFATTTIASTGYGDVVPKSPFTRGVTSGVQFVIIFAALMTSLQQRHFLHRVFPCIEASIDSNVDCSTKQMTRSKWVVGTIAFWIAINTLMIYFECLKVDKTEYESHWMGQAVDASNPATEDQTVWAWLLMITMSLLCLFQCWFFNQKIGKIKHALAAFVTWLTLVCTMGVWPTGPASSEGRRRRG